MSAKGDLKPREYFWADFDPSNKCIELMDEVAHGIEGLIAVVQTVEDGTSFALVSDNRLDNITIDLWANKVRKQLVRVKKDQRHTLVGNETRSPDKDFFETYSERYSLGRA